MEEDWALDISIGLCCTQIVTILRSIILFLVEHFIAGGQRMANGRDAHAESESMSTNIPS